MSRADQGDVAHRTWRTLRVCAVAGLLAWAVWMGWDVHHDIDAFGNATGPYEQWQVVGSALTLLGVVILTGLLLEPAAAFRAYAIITVAYTAGFCVSALVVSALYPEGGANLWPISAAVLLLGVGFGAYVIGGIVSLLREAVRRGRTTRRTDGRSHDGGVRHGGGRP